MALLTFGAVSGVLLNRRLPYIVTNKLKGESQSYVLLGPHLLVAVFIATAWIVGIISGVKVHPVVHGLAGTTLLGIFLFACYRAH
jgi:hypothetical protein